MYRRPIPGQLSFETFYLPFGGKLSGENRWVKLCVNGDVLLDHLDWDNFNEALWTLSCLGAR